MKPESLLSRLKKDIRPDADAKARVLRSIQARMVAESPLFTELKKAVTPRKPLKGILWDRIVPFVELPQEVAFKQLRGTLHPKERFRENLKARILRTIREPVRAIAYGSQAFKWAAAFVVIGILVRVSPMLFLASSTVAESAALLLPTRGEVSVSIGGLWQTVDGQLTLEPGMKLRTHDGEASIILRDDGVVRLDKETTLEINDLSARLEPATDIFPSITLRTGNIWLQGLVPAQLRGITVATDFGQVTVNEGSVAIIQNEFVDVEVYDRSAVIQTGDLISYLTAGDRTRLSDESVLLVKQIPTASYELTWADQNLKRDAVHRHGIAQLQHERRIAKAGILPTSVFYPVKRFAERMEVLMTFNQQSRVQKQLQLAETRLNEAAALIYEGETAELPLEEYKATLQSIAEGHGSLAEFLVQRAIAETTAHMSAALPGDESYVIKKTVLETSANLPSQIARSENAQGSLLLDGLAAMLKASDQGQTAMMQSLWSDLHPYVVTLEDESLILDPSMQKEATTLLTFLASALQVASERGAAIDPKLMEEIAAYLPASQEEAITEVSLSEEEIMAIVWDIREKIFIYDITQSRINQFLVEIKTLQNHPDQGRILRRLAAVLPEGPEDFPARVYKEIVKLRWDRSSGEVI